MNNNYKYLAWSGTVALIMLTIFLGVNAIQLSNTATTTNTVSFNGEGKVTAKPDVAAISFSIVTEAATSKAAQDQNSVKSNKVTDFLKQQKIDPKDIKTSGYNVYPQYNNYPRPCPMDSKMMAPSRDGTIPQSYPCIIDKQRISGYQVTQSFGVKVRSIDNVGTILDGLVAAGANQVNNLGFQVDNPEKLKSEARAKAVEDAKKKAHELESQVGVKLGRIVNYSENTGGWPIYFEAKAISADGRGGGAPAPSIPIGENEITVNVTITYQIK